MHELREEEGKGAEDWAFEANIEGRRGRGTNAEARTLGQRLEGKRKEEEC